MLEWRLTAVSSARIAVIFGSHGVFVSYIPNCTVQGAVPAAAGMEVVRTSNCATANPAISDAHALWRFIRPPIPASRGRIPGYGRSTPAQLKPCAARGVAPSNRR